MTNFKKKIKRFIIFRPGSLGDTLIMAPLLWELKKVYPATTIEYLAECPRDSRNVTVEEIANLIPEIDKVILYKMGESWLRRLGSIKKDLLLGSEDTLLYLCNERRNIVFVFRDWIFFSLAGAGLIIGLVETMWDILTRRHQSEYKRIWRQVGSLGIIEPQRINQHKILEDTVWADDFWEKHKLKGLFVIAVCPGSKMQSKRWPIENFAEVIKSVGEQKKIAFVLIGDHRDRELVDHLAAAKFPFQVVSAAGCDLMQTSGLLARSELYLGNDTGPMHLAALHRKPCIAIFSSRDQEGRWYPLGSDNIVFRGKIECEGCMRSQCYANPAPCLTQITPEQVSQACIWLIRRKGGTEKK